VSKDETVEFEGVEITAVSPLAVRCIIEGKAHWIPQSQIHDDSEIWKLGDKGKLVITRWMAELKELI
jgi:hypothetical protein